MATSAHLSRVSSAQTRVSDRDVLGNALLNDSVALLAAESDAFLTEVETEDEDASVKNGL